MSGLHDRQVLLFGKAGQAKLAAARITVIGIGGLGTHVVQQLAYLGVNALTLVDDEELERSNLNRYVGARHDDRIVGTWKVDIGERLVCAVNPQATVRKIRDTAVSNDCFGAAIASDLVVSCVDNEGTRLILNELCSAYGKPYIDLATEIEPDGHRYGGRVIAVANRPGCMLCLGQLDVQEAVRDLEDPDRRAERKALYGLDMTAAQTAPSVVSINGVVASLAVTEMMCAITGLRPAFRVLTYRGDRGIVTVSADQPTPGCPACSLHGQGETAGIESYISRGVLRRST